MTTLTERIAALEADIKSQAERIMALAEALETLKTGVERPKDWTADAKVDPEKAAEATYALALAFKWGESPQGFEFWNWVRETLYAIANGNPHNPDYGPQPPAPLNGWKETP